MNDAPGLPAGPVRHAIVGTLPMTSPPMLIRPLEPADLPAAAALLHRTAGEFILHESCPEDAVAFLAQHDEAGLRRNLAAGFVYHVALVQDELVGFIGLRERSHVFHLFVDAHRQRRGVARRLWEAARHAALAADGGAGHAGVFTVNASNAAVPFYEALGFVRTAPMQVAQVRYNPMRLGSATAPLVGPA
jgi:ribosomal protein S18 acetylase RimI-like enzyme